MNEYNYSEALKPLNNAIKRVGTVGLAKAGDTYLTLAQAIKVIYQENPNLKSEEIHSRAVAMATASILSIIGE